MKVEEDTHSDANLEAMFGLFRLQEPQDMVCDNSKDIKRMCINPECEEVSLTCNDLDCEKCHNRTHNQCPCVQLLGVTQELRRKIDIQKDFVTSICEIQNQFIVELEKTRLPLTEKYRFGDLEEKYLRYVEEIYVNKNFNILHGKQSEDFWKRLKKLGKTSNKAISNPLLNIYKTSFARVKEYIKVLKQKLYDAYSSGKIPQELEKEYSVSDLSLFFKEKSIKQKEKEELQLKKIEKQEQYLKELSNKYKILETDKIICERQMQDSRAKLISFQNQNTQLYQELKISHEKNRNHEYQIEQMIIEMNKLKNMKTEQKKYIQKTPTLVVTKQQETISEELFWQATKTMASIQGKTKIVKLYLSVESKASFMKKQKFHHLGFNKEYLDSKKMDIVDVPKPQSRVKITPLQKQKQKQKELTYIHSRKFCLIYLENIFSFSKELAEFTSLRSLIFSFPNELQNRECWHFLADQINSLRHLEKLELRMPHDKIVDNHFGNWTTNLKVKPVFVYI